MAEAAARSADGFLGNARQFTRSIGSPDGDSAIGYHNRRNERRDEKAKKPKRQRMAYQVE